MKKADKKVNMIQIKYLKVSQKKKREKAFEASLCLFCKVLHAHQVVRLSSVQVSLVMDFSPIFTAVL